jgi:hypothetical protein
MPVGFPVKDNYVTGDVLTAANMNDFAGTLNTVPTTIGTGNAIINGGMDIWQRGTNFTAPSVYTADRWFRDAQTYSTISQQTTSDTTNLPTIFYSTRIARNSGQTGTASIGIISSLESLDSYRFAGQTVTLSFYARAGANFSAASNIAVADLYTGTGTNQRRDFSTAFTGEVVALSSNATLTTTWQRFSFTATLAATATEIAVRVRYSPTGTAGANDWMEVTGVQLERGSVATTFKRSNGAGGNIQGELAACQRYYYRITPTANGQKYTVGSCETTTAAELVVPFPVSMRIAPTALEQSGTATDYSIRAGATVTTCNGTPVFLIGTTNNSSIYFYVASGLTVGQIALGRVANTNGFLGWSAEL